MNYNWALEAISQLQAEMRMVPWCSVLGGTEFICQCPTGRNWTLRSSWNAFTVSVQNRDIFHLRRKEDTVIFIWAKLPDPVPMDSSSTRNTSSVSTPEKRAELELPIIFHFVCNMYDYVVAPIRFYGRSRETAIEDEYLTFVSIRCQTDVLRLEPILNQDTFIRKCTSKRTHWLSGWFQLLLWFPQYLESHYSSRCQCCSRPSTV